jgi:DNA replication and repair protein RecF
MSELDRERRERLVARLAVGQAVITSTDLAHVPGGDEAGVTRIAVVDGVASPQSGPVSVVVAA